LGVSAEQLAREALCFVRMSDGIQMWVFMAMNICVGPVLNASCTVITVALTCLSNLSDPKERQMTNRTPGEAEAEFIKLIEDTRKRAVFPPGDPNGSIPPHGIKVQDDCTGEILFELHKDDWLDKWGCIVGGTYHTMFGLPRSLKEFDERVVPEYTPEDGGSIRRQRELFAVKAAGVLLHGEPRGMSAFSAPGLGKTHTSQNISRSLGLHFSTIVLPNPTAAGLKEYLADHRGPNSLVIIDDALLAMRNEALVTLLLDLLPVGGGPGIVRISTKEAKRNEKRDESRPEMPESEFNVMTRFMILGNDNVTDATAQRSNTNLTLVLQALESRIGRPLLWSFDMLERLYFVLWFARAGNIIQHWWPEATLKDANQILARFIETAQYRQDISLRGLQLLTTYRKIWGNNWLNFDEADLTSSGERKVVHLEPGLGKKDEPAGRKIPDWIWRRRAAYIFIPQRGGGGLGPGTPPKPPTCQPRQPQHWTQVVATFGGRSYYYPMSEHGFSQLQLEYAAMRTENRDQLLENAVGILAASLKDGSEPYSMIKSD
jgi:hypothetical protein